MRLKLPITTGVAVMLIAGFCMPVSAGQFSVTPIRIFMTPKDRAVALTVTNDADEQLVMQADVFVWAQDENGEDKLTPSEDLFLSPPILKLAPKSRQVVRLAMIKRPTLSEQRSYRVIVREIPEARKGPAKGVEVKVALAFSLPIFITPPGTKRDLNCTIERSSPDTVQAMCENKGNAYTQLHDFVLKGADGKRLASREDGGYILPGIKRSFAIKRVDGKLPAGKAQLSMVLEDGSTKKFDVTLAD